MCETLEQVTHVSVKVSDTPSSSLLIFFYALDCSQDEYVNLDISGWSQQQFALHVFVCVICSFSVTQKSLLS